MTKFYDQSTTKGKCINYYNPEDPDTFKFLGIYYSRENGTCYSDGYRITYAEFKAAQREVMKIARNNGFQKKGGK